MKLSMISECFQDESDFGLEETFRRMGEMGWDGVDYTLVPSVGKPVYNPFEDKNGFEAHLKKQKRKWIKTGLTAFNATQSSLPTVKKRALTLSPTVK